MAFVVLIASSISTLPKVQSGLVALLFGSAMVETKGLAWPWIMHFVIDLVIYTNLALA